MLIVSIPSQVEHTRVGVIRVANISPVGAAIHFGDSGVIADQGSATDASEHLRCLECGRARHAYVTTAKSHKAGTKRQDMYLVYFL